MTRDESNLDTALQISVEGYSAMLTLLQHISARISGESEVKSLVFEFTQQQQCLERKDILLMPLLEQFEKHNPGELTAHPLFKKRQELMGEVKRMNDLLLPKISGIIALLFKEIGELKGSRNAINGYRTQGRGAPSKRHYTA